MKVIAISIVLELEGEEEKGHATVLEYSAQMWKVNGMLFPRITSAMNEIVNLLRGRR